MKNKQNTPTSLKQITNGQVKQIASEISKRWRLVNKGSYYNVIDTKTGQSSIEGGDKNFSSYHMFCKIEFMYLKMIGENGLYFDWQSNGVEVSIKRKEYVYRIKDEIVRLLCGFQIENTKGLES